MGNALRQDDYISPAEYLAGEELSAEKHEYLDGIVHMMAGGSAGHDRIATNVVCILGNQLRGKRCEAFSADTRIRIRADKGEFYYYPDASVDCSGRANDSKYSENPTVVFEVLSPSTERVDRVEKLQNYQRIPSLEFYVIIDQHRIAVTIHRRTTDGWTTEFISDKGASLDLPCIACSLSIAEIYERTGL